MRRLSELQTIEVTVWLRVLYDHGTRTKYPLRNRRDAVQPLGLRRTPTRWKTGTHIRSVSVLFTINTSLQKRHGRPDSRNSWFLIWKSSRPLFPRVSHLGRHQAYVVAVISYIQDGEQKASRNGCSCSKKVRPGNAEGGLVSPRQTTILVPRIESVTKVEPVIGGRGYYVINFNSNQFNACWFDSDFI
jgi:hypothetical protein